jgi:predicted Zn-dependent protease
MRAQQKTIANQNVSPRSLFYRIGLIFLFLVIPAQQPVQAQQDENLLDGLLELADVLNQTMLELTAMSDEDENTIGEMLDKQLSTEMTFARERKYDVGEIFNTVLNLATRRNIDYQYKIVENSDVNAFAIAGGRIYINTGLLDYCDSPDELAFVIAHEISHIDLKHCIKRVQYYALASEVDPTLGEVVQVAYSIYYMPFSKRDEYEADENGFRLMQQAGYDKQGAFDFFTKLAELEKQYGVDNRDELNDFISSHPTALDRLERLKNM